MARSKRATADKPVLRLEWVEAGSLADNPANWRRHPKAQMAALQEVITDPEIGWAGACLYNARTKRLIDGHARKNAVTPETLVPVLVGDWSEEAERRILLSLDPLGAMARTDHEELEKLRKATDLGEGELAKLVDGLLEGGAQQPRPLACKPPPTMAWVLVGIPTARFAEIADLVEEIATKPDVLVETAVNDGDRN